VLTADGQAGDLIAQRLQERGLAVSVARELAGALPMLGQQDLIVLDAGDAASLAMLCRRISDEVGSRHSPILTVAHTADVDARVRLLEAGADDVIAQPVDATELDAIVDALLLRSAAALPEAGAQEPESAWQPPEAPGRVIAFGAAKGGSGTTTLAVNTSLVLAEMAPGSVAIADLDMYHAQVSTHLDIYARNSTAQLAAEDYTMQTPELIHEAGRQHPSGLMVFGGPYRPDEGVNLTPDQLVRLVDALRRVYGTVIVDSGSTLDDRAMALLAAADHVVMPITPDIPALRLLHAALQVLSEGGPVTEKTTFIINDICARSTITPAQVEEHLGIKVTLEVPYDGENFLRAVNEGHPLMSLARRSAAAAAIKRLAELTAETRLEDEAAEPPRRNLLRGLLGRG